MRYRARHRPFFLFAIETACLALLRAGRAEVRGYERELKELRSKILG